MLRKTMAFLTIGLLAFALGGCGSNRSSGGDSTAGATNFGNDPATGTAFVGAGTCIGCHEDFSWSSDDVSKYLVGKHVIHSDHINAESEPVCLGCHDPVGDGKTIEGLIDPANVPAEGLAAVGCENCHGAGGEHFGVGPISNATPGPDTCGKCHDDQWESIPEAAGHLNYHPEGNGIYSDYQTSGHAESINSHVYVSGSTTDVKAPCGRCHTDEGGRLYKDINTAQGLNNVLTVQNASNVQCRTCHDPHQPDALLKGATTTASAEYNTCTNCHQGDNAAPLKDGDSGYSATADLHDQIIYHADRYDHVITWNHYDDPATPDVIEGFVVNKAGDRSCRDCHNVHSADLSINEQWAESGHAAHIAIAKDNADGGVVSTANTLAVKQAGVDKNSADPELYEAAQAFTHWATVPDASCQRCHSATGAKNYLSDPVNYNSANNDFSYLEDGQHELLYCWACHAKNNGKLNQPGAITADYNFNGANAAFPDEDASNVCIACHSGRESGETIEALTAAANDFTNVGFKNSHYMAAAGLMFVKVGYTNFVSADTPVDAANPTTSDSYGQTLTSDSDTTVDVTGATVAGKLTSTHREFGTEELIGNHGITADQTEMIEGGPCVTCHMADRDENSKRSHTLEIDANAYTKICSNCHTAESGVALTAENFETIFLEPNSEAFQAAINLAKIELLNNYNISYDPSAYPYFYDESNGHTAVKDWTRASFLTTPLSAADAEKLMGAAFNINLLNREPAAFAHARTYSRRLLYDTVDFLDNGAIDQSVSTIAFADDAAEFTKGTVAFDGGAPYRGGTLNAGTTEGAAFILGWGSDGSWKTPERP